MKNKIIDITCTVGITITVLFILSFTGIMKPVGFNAYLATQKDAETEILAQWLCGWVKN